MASHAAEGVVQVGKLTIHIAENGHSYEYECDEYSLVETVQKFLESVTGILGNDQLLLCLDMKLDPQRPLSFYTLPSDREVFLFNKARMRSNSAPPSPEQAEIICIPDPPLPSSSHNTHPLDTASDPALKALKASERQFRYHFQYGHAIYSRTSAKLEACKRLLHEQKVQEGALEIARGNLDHFYKIVLQNYSEFIKCYSQQHRNHTSLLVNFGRDIEKLRSVRLFPTLMTSNQRCLFDFVREENLRKTLEDCSCSHRQFENKVSEFKQEFGHLKHNTEILFSGETFLLVKDLDLTIKDHMRYINEQKSIMQALSKDINTVKKLVDDSLSGQLSSSLRPHDAVSALGPMYDNHDKSYLQRMKECDHAMSSLLSFCRDKKSEMNIHVHRYMQKIAYIQYTIKDVRCKFSVFQEALKRQDHQFEPLKVIRGIGPAYRACLAEVVRRKAEMKIYMGKAGQMTEKLATERDSEVRRRDEFLKVHSTYIPRDILTAMGLYDTPNPCAVNITPFDSNLLDIELSDVERYAPETLLGFYSKGEKHVTLKSALLMSSDASQSAKVEGSVVDIQETYDSPDLLEEPDLVEIAGTSKMEIENAKLKAELASKIALLCSISTEFDYESLDDNNIESILKTAAVKTSEALHLKDEYEKHLQKSLKEKQMQCESYEKQIQELQLRLSDQYLRGNKISIDVDRSTCVVSTARNDDHKSGILGDGGADMSGEMEDVSCASSPLKSEIFQEDDKTQGRCDDSMTDSSSVPNPPLDSSMLDLHGDKGHLYDKNEREKSFSDEDTSLATSNMGVLISQPGGVLPIQNFEQDLDANVNDNLMLELRNSLALKSSQIDDAAVKIKALIEEVSKLQRELEISQTLLDESQMNCAHLENCLHEAKEEAQTHLCAADRRASEYSALRGSAIKMHVLFEKLRSCVSSARVADFGDSLRSLSQSLSSDDDSTAEFRECIMALADRVGVLSRQRVELLDRCSKEESLNEQLNKDLEEKKEVISMLYTKHQLEKQASKEKLSFCRLEVHEIAAFVLNSSGYYEAINRNCPHYYLSAESVALFSDHLSSRTSYIVGQVVHIERQTAKSPPSSSVIAESIRDWPALEMGTSRLTSGPGSASNPYGLPVGCEYFVVTIAMLPDTTIHSTPS